jgi:hypothetical protein
MLNVATTIGAGVVVGIQASVEATRDLPSPPWKTRLRSVAIGGASGDRSQPIHLSVTQTWVWYLIAAVSYIGFGMFHKWLLTWFLGPAWLVGVVVGGPAVWNRLRHR